MIILKLEQIMTVESRTISMEFHGCYRRLLLNSFQAIRDLLNSENLKVAFTQLCNELQIGDIIIS